MSIRTEFDDPDQADAEAVDHLLNKFPSLEHPIIEGIVDRAGVVERIEILPNKKEMQLGGVHKALVGHYVIRNDLLMSLDNFLSLLKSAGHLTSGVLTLWTAASMTPAGIKDTVDGIYSLYETFTKIMAKTWHLSDKELTVVLAVRSSGPARADILAGKLGDVGTEHVEKILGRFERREDNPSGFTVRMSDGAWRLEGV